jgi:hypothetical protein
MFPKGLGPVTVALTAYDIWRRLPPAHRRRILAEARRQGPRIAAVTLAAVKRRRDRRR